jgi:hypothetical protein
MKTFWVCINYDSGSTVEYYTESTSESAVYNEVYLDLGFDPGEVYVEEVKETQ